MLQSLLSVPRMPIVSQVSFTSMPSTGRARRKMMTREPPSASSTRAIDEKCVQIADSVPKILSPVTR